MNYFFTSDEHYFHTNVIKHCNRPFNDVEEMHHELIKRNNEVVSKNDTVIHAGDFSFGYKNLTEKIIKQLNGHHVFLKGSHDRWLTGRYHEIWEKKIENHFIVVCHYCMRVWARSHYGSWHLFGHSHGGLNPEGKSWDIGVDNNNFYPVSFEQIKNIMKDRPDNFNLIRK